MSKFDNYLNTYRNIAKKNKLNWEMKVNEDGSIVNQNSWDLSEISGVKNRQHVRLNNFSMHEFYNIHCHLNNIKKEQLVFNQQWQDLIKAYCIEKLIVDKISAFSVQTSILPPLRILASFLNHITPTDITSHDIAYVCKIVQNITGNNILVDWILGISKNLIDKNFLSIFSPITISAKELLLDVKKDSPNQILPTLDSRKHGNKLPKKEAYWELTRIVFTIEPKSYIDQIKFAQIQLMIMTGLRIGEIVKLPKDCLVGPFEVLSDEIFKSNQKFGAIKEYYKLKYFAEKQISGNKTDRNLEIAYYTIPSIFLEPITSIINFIEKLSSPLRKTLLEIENKKFYINKKNHKFISAIDVYLLITGNSNFIEGYSEKIQQIKSLYILDRYTVVIQHVDFQKQQKNQQFTANFYEFFQKLKKIVPPHNPTDKPWKSKINWWDAQFKISDIAIYLECMPSKLPDLYIFNIDKKQEIRSSDFLFLYPKRAILETRNDGIIDISKTYSIGVPDRQFLETFLRHAENTTPTIFEVYSPDELKDREVMPHSLRHLLNTELFRKGLSTLAITKQFNRKSITQTLDYDHRSLLESFEEVEITKTGNEILNSRTVELAKLIKINRANGPIVHQFKTIQKNQGEEAAYHFLNAEAGGIHSTPYGHCLNSFSVDPCPKHLECFSGCNHLSATNLPEQRTNLESLLDKFISHKQQVLDLPPNSFGKENKINYLEKKIKGIVQLLNTSTNQKAFPDGEDLSIVKKDIFDE